MEENIADALKMAGSVLLFVIGLSIAILSFSQAREAIDVILSYSDRESLTIENNSRFYYLSSGSDTNRYVGKETIIPALYRAYKENYKIVFKFPDGYYLFKNSEGEEEGIKEIDLANQSIGSDLESRQFLNGLIYGYAPDDSNEEWLTEQDYKNTFGTVTLNSEESLYTYLSDKTFKESLGTYYIEDLDQDGDGHPDWEQQQVNGEWTTGVEEANRTKKRVITYSFENN